MSKFKLVWNYKGFGELLKSQEMGNALTEVANNVRSRAGNTGYATDIKVMPSRAIASVYTDSEETYQDNLDNNTLLKALGN